MSRKKNKKSISKNVRKKKSSTDSYPDEKKDEPNVFKIVTDSRRKFIKKAAQGVAGFSVLSNLLSGCKDSMIIDIQTEERIDCSCHVVCSCDKVSETSSNYNAQWNNGVCTCNTVCTCDTVCTCNSEGGGGGGGSYYYTYWYPN